MKSEEPIMQFHPNNNEKFIYVVWTSVPYWFLLSLAGGQLRIWSAVSFR